MKSDNNNRTKEPFPPARINAPWATRDRGTKLASVPETIASRKSISQDQRRKLIAEAAYLKAEHRGFRGGSAEQDWIAAEAEIDANLVKLR
ncbi:MAG: DUF2934 domain-containing protein [Acidobacteriia bacterium]|nr:DUF2934 domain-containing protein [Terriglobia bacterium]